MRIAYTPVHCFYLYLQEGGEAQTSPSPVLLISLSGFELFNLIFISRAT